jgi:aspartyl-tRNA(Asn)/glutamyl-tRNA(Gln) amidotransferase subunit A
MKEIWSFSIARESLVKGRMSCVELVTHFINRSQEFAHYNVWLELFESTALAQAQIVDQRVAAGQLLPLDGFILGIKDVLCHTGHGVTAGSQILKGHNSLFTATSVSRLEAQGAIVLGRLNCDEFAMGSSNENSSYGPVLNPLDPTRVPGGSSGGSAAAVAAGLCHASLGTDTGGSIRQPAAFCGLVGLKPTYSRVSRYGMLAYASSFDQIGPITHTVEDTALLLSFMAGKDTADATSSPEPVPNYSEFLTQPGKSLKLGIIRETLDMPGLDPEIKNWFDQYINQLKESGHEIVDISFPYLNHTVPTYYVLTTAEASSNLSRYDGVRFGYRAPNADTIEEVYFQSRSKGFGAEVKRRIMLGTFVLSAGYYDAYYTRAMQVRRKIADATQEALSKCDFLLSPTTPTVAFELGEKSKDPIAMYLSDIFTVQANLSGHPAITVPVSGHSSGLPFGIQLLGDYFSEANLLSFAQQVMQNNWTEPNRS